MQIPIIQARNRFHELARRAEAGAVIILTRRGKPVARLEAAQSPPVRQSQPPGQRLAAIHDVSN